MTECFNNFFKGTDSALITTVDGSNCSLHHLFCPCKKQSMTIAGNSAAGGTGLCFLTWRILQAEVCRGVVGGPCVLVRVEHGPSAVTNCEYCVLLSIREDCVCVCVWGRKPSGSWSIDHLSHTVSRSRQTPGPLTDNYKLSHIYTR